MDKSGGISIYIIYVCMYTVAKFKISMAHISGPNKQKCTKLGKCGALLCIKQRKIFGLHWAAHSF